MNDLAIIKKIDSKIEEEIIVEINNIQLTIFGNICPYIIEEGKFYRIKLNIMVLEDFEIELQNDNKKEFIRINDTYGYEIKGILTKEGNLDAGIMLESEMFKDYQYLYEKFVKIKVDRINAEFL